MTMVPATILSAVVTILAVIFIFYTGLNVAMMRSKHGVKAPAITGPVEFECAVRVQVNTLEQAILFFPLLWVATIYFRTLAWLPAVLGLVWVIGRVIYMQGYMQAPEKRGTGFIITQFGNAGLLVVGVIGLVQSWLALHGV